MSEAAKFELEAAQPKPKAVAGPAVSLPMRSTLVVNLLWLTGNKMASLRLSKDTKVEELANQIRSQMPQSKNKNIVLMWNKKRLSDNGYPLENYGMCNNAAYDVFVVFKSPEIDPARKIEHYFTYGIWVTLIYKS